MTTRRTVLKGLVAASAAASFHALPDGDWYTVTRGQDSSLLRWSGSEWSTVSPQLMDWMSHHS